MGSPDVIDDNDVDKHVDEKISACLNLIKPASFFLFAGAGSGKTGSLVKALERLRDESGKILRLRGQRVAVITYTNAACDEIKHRLAYDPLFEVSTIHSFVWLLIGGFNTDIKQWLQVNLDTEIAEITELQGKGRAGKAALDRKKSIEAKQKRLARLDEIKSFTYSPSRNNPARDALNHSEVIKIGADFLMKKPLMQKILTNKFPILLIDESQDTNKLLMDAFLAIQVEHKEYFSLGLLGDTMQRIYADGKTNLGNGLPPDWAKPVKKMNHRCPQRIVKLINKIRSVVDDQEQTPRKDNDKGVVRLFIFPSETIDKSGSEHKAMLRMTNITSDSHWSGDSATVKTLILEHHMAARRMAFLDMFETLHQNEKLRTGLLDGSLAGLRFFSDLIFPLVRAKQNGDDFTATAIARNDSPLLSKSTLKAAGVEQLLQIKATRDAIAELMALWSDGEKPRFIDVLRCIAQTGLFDIPESLRPIAMRNEAEQEDAETSMTTAPVEEDDTNQYLDTWDKFLLTPFSQIEPYIAYINGQASFDTHQGVKGLQFPRVLVILDDTESRGSLFSYDKLFGTKDKTKTDMDNERDGKETGIDRTRRLFYVICSRAQSSLAIVAYSSAPEKFRDNAVRDGWFEASEVEIMT
jgi:DNA helicase-2/ATP-dependent DNA helicase PcrA